MRKLEEDNMISQSARDGFLSLGIWSWLAIVDEEKENLSVSGQFALSLLREDLERLYVDAG